MRRLVVGLLRLAAIIGGGGLAVAFTLAAIAPRLGDIFTANESASAEIDLNELALRSIVYDMHGDEFDVLYDVENRELVTLDDISHAMIMSLLVVEDEGFYDHNGVDAKAIGRAFIENVNAGGIEQGGSTITQQLIKNAVLSSEQQLERKIPEAALAIRLENQLTKDEILEAYLNTVYFGSGAYGVRAAAEIYFGVSPDRLTWPQGALLAGLIANPDRYDPTRFPDIADERRTLALLRLLETGNITDEQYDRYVDAPLPTERRVPAEWEPTSYFIEEVRRQLLEDPRLGATFDERADLLFGGGLRVFTTYDPAAQTAASAAVDHVHDWVLGTPAGDWVSMAIPSDGSYGVPEGLMSSFPVTCSGGDYSIVQGLEIDEFSQGRIDATVAELAEEGANVASRKASQMALQKLGPMLPEMVGGSADLARVIS